MVKSRDGFSCRRLFFAVKSHASFIAEENSAAVVRHS